MSARGSHERPAAPGRAPARRQHGGERPGHAGRGAHAPRRATRTAAVEDRPLRLLVGRTRPMSEPEYGRLVAALAELLADWLGDHPERLPSDLRTAASSDLLDGPDAKEKP